LLIGVGQNVVDDLIKVGVGTPQKFIVINPGLEVRMTKDRHEVRKQLGIDEETFLISWVGRFTEIKSPDRVIDIARILKETKKSVKFIMVGGGSLFDYMKRIADFEELPIIFLGWRKDPVDVIGSSDLLLMTSKNEGTPISAIQAQIIGIPVLTTDVGAVREIVSDLESGFVRTYDPILFSELIIQLSTDKDLWNNQSRQAKIISEGRFSVDRLTKDHEVLYRNLMTRNLSS
jgi:glycosyltransferase involved in cell wall biosynthesis